MGDSVKRLIVVSNRLPFVLSKAEDGRTWSMKAGSGGLVTALLPVLRNRGGIWIGWPGTTEEVPGLKGILAQATRNAGYTLRAVPLSEKERDLFYLGYANEIVWPLFHDLPSLCNFEPAYLQASVQINTRFAEAIAACCRPTDFVWVHDYHLMLTAQALRRMGFQGSLAFFLHIPFPPLDIFLKMPHRSQLLRGLLDFDLIGFQTQRKVIRTFDEYFWKDLGASHFSNKAGLLIFPFHKFTSL